MSTMRHGGIESGSRRHPDAAPADVAPGGLMSAEVNVQRIMSTGRLWFMAQVVAVAIVGGMLVSSGWRPSELPALLEVVWWAGVLVVAASVGLVGWSGCPILEVSVEVADRNKSRTMQWGTAMFIAGGAVVLIAMMAG